MDATAGRNPSGGPRAVRAVLLLWCLTGVRSTGEITTKQASGEEGLQTIISGPPYVTVGVPASFQCLASCPGSGCNYSVAVDNQTASGQGGVLSFTPRRWLRTLTLSCKASAAGATQTVTKTVQVLAGPANVSVAGPATLIPETSYTYSCHADCIPPCNYTWMMGEDLWVAGQGNTISIYPRASDTFSAVVCKATNVVSGLFAAKAKAVLVASGPLETGIEGPYIIPRATPTNFTCVSDCTPPCDFLWTVGDRSLNGSQVQVTVDRAGWFVELKCEARNPVSLQSASVSRTVLLTAQGRAARAEGRSALLLGGLLAAAAILL